MNNENLVMNLLEMLIKAESNKSVEPLKNWEFPKLNGADFTRAKSEGTDLIDDSNLSKAGPFIEVGKAYLFRTVTHIELGEVEAVHGDFVKIVKASWIADTGRYHDCLKHGELNEVEPYPDYTVVHLSSLINFAPWNHALPLEQK
jgi:hypothetical protein